MAFDLAPVSEELFAQAVEELKPIIIEESRLSDMSTFGILTAIFFHLASKRIPAVNWQVVEVGMGGRYDATNVFDAKDCAVMTAISLEHIEALGTSQCEIAANKAGIITPGAIAILAPQKDRSVKNVVGRRCLEVGASLLDVGRTYKIKSLSHDLRGQSFVLDGPHGVLELTIPMLGEHQLSNAATAAATALALRERGADISDEDIAGGLPVPKFMDDWSYSLIQPQPVDPRDHILLATVLTIMNRRQHWWRHCDCCSRARAAFLSLVSTTTRTLMLFIGSSAR